MAADVKLLKAALEDAKFDDVDIREAIYKCINSLAEDLISVNFSAGKETDDAFDELEELLNAEMEPVLPTDEDEDEEEDVDEILLGEDDDEDDDENGITLGDEDEDEDN